MSSDHQVAAFVAVANRRLSRKLVVIAFLIACLFGISAMTETLSLSVAAAIATHVPSVQKLLVGGLATGTLPARFFSLALIGLPFFLIYLLIREDPRKRVRYGARLRGGNSVGSYLFAYLVLLPFCLFILFIAYAAPIGLPDAPHLWGQYLLSGMLNSYIGLLFLGTGLVLAVLVCLFAVALFLWLPFSHAIERKLKGGRYPSATKAAMVIAFACALAFAVGVPRKRLDLVGGERFLQDLGTRARVLHCIAGGLAIFAPFLVVADPAATHQKSTWFFRVVAQEPLALAFWATSYFLYSTAFMFLARLGFSAKGKAVSQGPG